MTEEGEKSRSLLGEAMFLAVSPVVAYVLAFAFEAGHARRLGYPLWVIEIAPTNVAIAWAALAGGLMLLSLLAVMITAHLPISVVHVVVSRPFFSIVLAAVLSWGLWNPGPTGPTLAQWFLRGLSSLCVVWVAIEAAWWYRDYRRTDSSLGFWTRLASATRTSQEDMEMYRDQRRRDSPRSLLDHSERLRRAMACIHLFGVVTCVLTFSAMGWGYFEAGRRASFLVSEEAAELVALRRFGNTLVAAEVEGRAIGAIRILDATDPSRRWVRRYVGTLTSMP